MLTLEICRSVLEWFKVIYVMSKQKQFGNVIEHEFTTVVPDKCVMVNGKGLKCKAKHLTSSI